MSRYEPKKKSISVEEDPVDLPPAPQTFLCGTMGVWKGGSWVGAIGCLGTFPKDGYHFGARMCRYCVSAMCAEFDCPPEAASSLECAVRSHHRYVDRLPSLGSLGRFVGVRMLVLAVGTEIRNKTDTEIRGAEKLAKAFKMDTVPVLGEIQ